MSLRRKQYQAQLDAIRAYLAGAAEHMAAMRERQQARRGKLEAQVTALRAALKEAEKRRRAAEAAARQGAGGDEAEVGVSCATRRRRPCVCQRA